jgi:hypothetical protein
MLLEAREMQAGQDKIQEELKEVEEELDAAEGHIPMRNMEEGKQPLLCNHSCSLSLTSNPRRTTL